MGLRQSLPGMSEGRKRGVPAALAEGRERAKGLRKTGTDSAWPWEPLEGLWLLLQLREENIGGA